MKNCRGFTLVEVMFSIGLLAILMYFGSVFARQTGNSEETILRSRDSNEAIRRTLDTVAADFRNSSFSQSKIRILPGAGVDAGSGPTDIVELQTTLLEQRVLDLDGDGTLGEMEEPGVDLDGDGLPGEREVVECPGR